MKAPYDILGVPCTASEAEIKASYRRAAKTLHPDMPDGDREAFDELQMAYDLLMDPKRRAHYDATGETTDREADNARAVVLSELARAFEAAMRKAGEQGREPHQADMVALMREHLESGIRARVDENAKAAKARRKWAELRKRFHAPDGTPNVMAAIIDSKIDAIDEITRRHEEDNERLRTALDALEGYAFDFDAPETPEQSLARMLHASADQRQGLFNAWFSGVTTGNMT